jgi:hypothetical protein
MGRKAAPGHAAMGQSAGTTRPAAAPSRSPLCQEREGAGPLRATVCAPRGSGRAATRGTAVAGRGVAAVAACGDEEAVVGGIATYGSLPPLATSRSGSGVNERERKEERERGEWS